jgi:hypothetical protein
MDILKRFSEQSQKTMEFCASGSPFRVNIIIFPKMSKFSRYSLSRFVLKGIVGFWLSSIPARSSDAKLARRCLLDVRFLCFHNCCLCSLFWLFWVDFISHCPLFSCLYWMDQGNQRRSADFGELLQNISLLRRSLCHILWCTNVTASFGDAPVDEDQRNVFPSGGQGDSLDSISSFFDWYKLLVTNAHVQRRDFHGYLSALPRQTIRNDFVLSYKAVVKSRTKISTSMY